MSAPRSITEFEFKRLAELAKQERVRVRYQRRPDLPVVEISPDIPATPKPEDVDEPEIVL
ncbi:MAG: hypothetical protein Kow0026_08310 [Oricola sp.]